VRPPRRFGRQGLQLKRGLTRLSRKGSKPEDTGGSFDAAAAEREGVGLVALVPRVADETGLLVIAARWNRRRAGRRSCLDHWSECRHARHSLSALPRSADEPGVGQCVGRSRTGKHRSDAGLHRTIRPGNRYRFRESSGISGRASTGTLSSPTGADRGHERGRRSGRDYHRMQVWAGHAAALAKAIPAGSLVQDIWTDAQRLMGLP
jgi:nitronate monooxygenase